MTFGQRKHDRFVLLQGGFAAIGRNYTKVGKIKDIGLGGLAFEYFAAGSGSTDDAEVDIFLAENLFRLYNLPCEIVYDIVIHPPHVDSRLSRTLATKRCGLAFQNLKVEETNQLKFFLHAYSVGMA